jgi:predicted nucleic acid-binding protein
LTVIDICNVFDFLNRKGRFEGVKNLLTHSQAALSVFTVYEVLRGVNNADSLAVRHEFIHYCQVLDIDAKVAAIAGEIYTDLKSRGELIANEDILIAATAMRWNYPLLTDNLKDFKRIKGIKII